MGKGRQELEGTWKGGQPQKEGVARSDSKVQGANFTNLHKLKKGFLKCWVDIVAVSKVEQKNTSFGG